MLNKQNLFVNFNKGVDSGRDPKTVIPSKFTKLDNLEWDKTQNVVQRPGFTKATLTAHTNSTTVSNIKQLHNLGAELILEAVTGFHAFEQNRTISRDLIDNYGSFTPQPIDRMRLDVTDVTASGVNQYNFDAATADPSGLECWAWEEYSAVAVNKIVRYQIVDGKTRGILQSGIVQGSSSVAAMNPRVVVRNSGGASTFYIYFVTVQAGTYDIERCSIAVAAGASIPGALSSTSVVVTPVSASGDGKGGFDAWYAPTGDVVLLAYENSTQDLTLAILTGSDGLTVSATSNQNTTTSALGISVTAVYNGSTGYGLATYSDNYGAIHAFSTKFDGTADLDTTLTTGATVSGYLAPDSTNVLPSGAYVSGRTTVIADPFQAGKAVVFYDTVYSANSTLGTAGIVGVFPEDIGIVLCNYDGASPLSQGVLARGVSLAARPIAYASGGVTRLCVAGALLSDLQPTIFLLQIDGTDDNHFSGKNRTIAGQSYAPPQILGRALPGTCANLGNIVNPKKSVSRLPTPMAVV